MWCIQWPLRATAHRAGQHGAPTRPGALPAFPGPRPSGGGLATPPRERGGLFQVSADRWNPPRRLSVRNASSFRAQDFAVPVRATPRASAQKHVGTPGACQAPESARETALLPLVHQRPSQPLRVAKAQRNPRCEPSACHYRRKGAAGFRVPVQPGIPRMGSYRSDHP
jgi:hypothetical protein